MYQQTFHHNDYDQIHPQVERKAKQTNRGVESLSVVT